jgi:two-component system invasion response regulator UvrY
MKTVALADDHVLLRKGLAGLINSFNNYNVIFEADNGKELIDYLRNNKLPDIVLLDITMPVMNGFEAAEILKNQYPQINTLALTMLNDDESVIKMIRNGVLGYLLKDTEPLEFKNALDIVSQRKYYLNEMITGNALSDVYVDEKNKTSQKVQLSDNEKKFLQLISSEKTHKEIAEIMTLSIRTIDGYRDSLFQKLNIKTKVGLVIYSIKNGLVTI